MQQKVIASHCLLGKFAYSYANVLQISGTKFSRGRRVDVAQMRLLLKNIIQDMKLHVMLYVVLRRQGGTLLLPVDFIYSLFRYLKIFAHKNS